ncbi:MAG: helix-turn-helix domain-containing protein, partial [Alphaproteobacteria bacterium]|nr:helix-turn-helix domain-containing protein [Alphaproteobacteria bacterium]
MSTILPSPKVKPPPKSLEQVIKAQVIITMDYFHGNKAKAAECLGITTKTLSAKLDMYDLKEKYSKK